MGYDISYSGRFSITPDLSARHVAELKTVTSQRNERNGGMTLGNPPSYYCPWRPTEEGDALMWDGEEKAQCGEEWLRYLIANFLQPWGHTVNGEVAWNGEESGDVGKIVITNNVVESKRAKLVYE